MLSKLPAALVLHRRPSTSGTVAVSSGTSRRSFLGGTLATTLAGVSMLPEGGLFAAGEQRLRIGLVGCGGRGTGAAAQAAAADPTVRVVALGDMFADQVASAAEVLGHSAGQQFDCPPTRQFVGADAYRHVIQSGVDVVLLATPPHVRPLHLEAAVDARKHVYCEKPAAIDVAGVVRVAAAAARGRAAGLALVSGFCFRQDAQLVELVARIHDGEIGRPLVVQAHAAIGLPWRKPAEQGQAAVEWPLRNWISFARFSGGHFVEHHVQAIDRAAWILGDQAPVRAEVLAEVFGEAAWASGDCDRGVATGAIGDCPTATAVRYTFADGSTIRASLGRRQRGSDMLVEAVVGTAGSCDLHRGTRDRPQPWEGSEVPRANRYQATIDRLIRGLLTGQAPHDGDTLCRSTLMAVMGRMAGETGRPVAWAEIADGVQMLA